ncbi:MAG: NDP-sugar synthase [Actinomycetota bacterium]
MLNAVILVGGEGTRLRPLTERMPKPMLPLLGRPLIDYTFDHLRSAGVGKAILACGYLPTQIQAHFGENAEGLELEYRVEPEPLGTGGGIRFGADGLDRTFLALNGDSLREADLARLIEFHRDRGAAATILLTPVDDPSRFGLVRVDDQGRVTGFLEKPKPEEIDTNLINAGLYVLEPEVLDLVPEGKQVSIERDVFPILADRGRLCALALPGYWLDVGTPASYLQAHLDLLERSAGNNIGPAVEGGDIELVPPVMAETEVVIEDGARVGPLVYLGAGSRVGSGAVVERVALLPGAVIPSGARIAGAIVSPEFGVIAA